MYRYCSNIYWLCSFTAADGQLTTESSNSSTSTKHDKSHSPTVHDSTVGVKSTTVSTMKTATVPPIKSTTTMTDKTTASTMSMCDYLCSIQQGGAACSCSKAIVPGK